MTLLERVPADARSLQDRGAFEQALQQCELTLLRMLGAGAGKQADTRRFRMPAGTDWRDVTAFYAAQLEPEWQRSEVAEQQLGFRLRMWHRLHGTVKQNMAVGLLDNSAVGMETPGAFRMLVLATDAG